MQTLLAICLLLGGSWLVYSELTSTDGLGATSRRETTHEIYRAAASDLIEQYDFLVHNGGSQMELCVQAGVIASSYMEANDSYKYRAWKAAEKRDCARAGL